jgi:hypothetical protein
MKKALYNLFMRDDRTNLPSATKFVRVSTFFLAVTWIFFCAGVLIFTIWYPLGADSEKILDSVSNLIILLFAGAETSYQSNRMGKMKFGTASLAEAETEEHTSQTEEVKRIEY